MWWTCICMLGIGLLIGYNISICDFSEVKSRKLKNWRNIVQTLPGARSPGVQDRNWKPRKVWNFEISGNLDQKLVLGLRVDSDSPRGIKLSWCFKSSFQRDWTCNESNDRRFFLGWTVYFLRAVWVRRTGIHFPNQKSAKQGSEWTYEVLSLGFTDYKDRHCGWTLAPHCEFHYWRRQNAEVERWSIGSIEWLTDWLTRKLAHGWQAARESDSV